MIWLLKLAGPIIRFAVRVALVIAAIVAVLALVGGLPIDLAAAQDGNNCEALKDHNESAYRACLEANGETPATTTTTAAASGPTGDDSESVLFYHGQGVRLHSITFNDDGEAVVRMSSETGGEQAVITDSSRQTSGEMERYRHQLEEGMNTFRVPLQNPSRGAITVDAAGSIWLEVDKDRINLAPDKGHAIGVAFGGAGILIALLVGLHLWQTRRADEAKNPL